VFLQLAAAAIACIAIDGDTIKCAGETIRLQNVDAAEIHGRCAYETDMAQRAKTFTSRRLSEGDIEIVVDRKHPRDRHGRTIAWVIISGRDLGEDLVAAGLARRWEGRRRPWC
jgi:micrococcal nuclease